MKSVRVIKILTASFLIYCLLLVSCKTLKTTDNQNYSETQDTKPTSIFDMRAEDLIGLSEEETEELIMNKIRETFPDANKITSRTFANSSEFENHMKNNFSLSVSPNPTSGDATVTINVSSSDFSGRNLTFDLYFEDRKINTLTLTVGSGNKAVLSSNYLQNNGVYTIALQESNIRGRQISTSFIVKK